MGALLSKSVAFVYLRSVVEDAKKKASNYLIFAEIDELGLIFTDPYLSQLILKAISKRKLFFSFYGG